MCGIFGLVTSDPALADRVRLDLALQALRHRGPDDSGTFDDVAGGARCRLAHTRLAILDLSPLGHQPMSTDDGRFTIVYNGEVYNHREIRKELESAGWRFRSTSDTEVILASYAQWGSGCLARLRGMFAFAVWDSHDGALFLARDRLGIKPLYYDVRADRLAFASELRALLAAGETSRRLNPRGVQSYLASGSVAEPETIIAGVLSLPPGTYLVYRGGECVTGRYWDLPHEQSSAATLDEVIDRTRSILRDAVAMRLVADVPVGIFLSGGVDSSAIVAFASQVTSSPLHTFTVTFDEEGFSEARYAAEVARHFRCDHNQVHLSASRVANEIQDTVAALDQPSADGVNTYFVAKAAKDAGLTVALSGLGGDELFAGYGHFRAFGTALRVAGALPQAPIDALSELCARWPFDRIPGRARKLAALLAARAGPASTYAVLRGMFTREQIDVLLRREMLELGAYRGPSLPDASCNSDHISEYSRLELDNYLRNTLLRDADTMSMAHALEVRVPLLDHVLVEQLLMTPGRLKLRRGVNKPLLVFAAPSIPRRALNRRKMGFTLPFDAWFRGPLRPWMEDVLLGSSVLELGFLRPETVGDLWRAFLKSDRYVSSSRVWCIAALAAWCKINEVTL